MHCSFGFEAARNIVFQLRSRPDKGGGQRMLYTAQMAADGANGGVDTS